MELGLNVTLRAYGMKLVSFTTFSLELPINDKTKPNDLCMNFVKLHS